MIIRGTAVSPGYATGPVYQVQGYAPDIRENYLAADETEQAVEQYLYARHSAKDELRALCKRLAWNKEKQKILTAHIDIVDDEAMAEDIISAIREKGCSPAWAVHTVFQAYTAMLAASSNLLTRERTNDLEDVRLRLLRCLEGRPEPGLAGLNRPSVIVAHDLLPSDTAGLDPSLALAIVAEKGGTTSHTAIMAKSEGIPAVLGVTGALEHLLDGTIAVVDACEGVVLVAPEKKQVEEYRKKAERFSKSGKESLAFQKKQARLASGEALEIYANIGSCSAEELACAAYTDGVGLLRTEFLYMHKDTLPTEEEQIDVYASVLRAWRGRAVTIRTLDIGGDKQLPALSMPKEDNPFLGVRALRLCFARPELFLTQLRALLRASVYGQLWVMFPMVGSPSDFLRAMDFVSHAKAKLDAENIPYSSSIRWGVMIEIPAAAMLAEEMAKIVDFASIGSNDLCQYLTAADRMNTDVAAYYDSGQSALLRLIEYVAQQFNKAGKPLSLCGEIGGDPRTAPLLVGAGLRKLSMSAASVAGIKQCIASLTSEQASRLFEQAKKGE